MKRVLILTVTAGNGHNSAANAVKEECEKNGAKVLLVDLLHEFCSNKTFIWIQEKGYPLACQYLPGVFNMFFRHFQKANPKKFFKSPVQRDLYSMYGKLLKLIYDFKPDAIFASHYYPCIMISNLRKIYSLPAKTFSFVFDYAVCPFWEAATGIDYLLIPNEKYVPTMTYKGFKADQLLPYGLVVNEKFTAKIDKQKAREMLGISKDRFTIFVMFGGGFWSGNYKITKNLLKNLKKEDVQIVIANGRDEKGKKKIDQLKVPKNIKVFNWGFCKNIDVIMSASDVLIGKAGGVSVTEALDKNLPLICCKKLPEQEKVNVKMLVKEGAAKQYKSNKMMISILSDLIDNPKELEKMKKEIDRIRRPHATKKLVEMMLSCEAEYVDTQVDFSVVNKNIKRMLKAGGGFSSSTFCNFVKICQYFDFYCAYD